MSFDAYINVEPTSGVACSLTIDDGTWIVGTGQQHVEFRGIPDQVQGWGGYVDASAAGYQGARVRVQVVAPALLNPKPPEGDGGYVFVKLEKVAPTIQALHIGPLGSAQEGEFVLSDGNLWSFAGIDGYSDVAVILNGQDLSPLLAESVELGANTRVVYACVQSFADINPVGNPAVYDALRTVIQLHRAKGLRTYVRSGDFNRYGMQRQAQIDHHLRTIDVMAPYADSCFLCPCNEPDNNGDEVGTDFAAIDRKGILASYGHPEPDPDGHGVTPCLDFHGHGSGRTYPRWIDLTALFYYREGVDKFGRKFDRKHPAVDEEPIGFGPMDIEGRRSSSERLAYQLGMLAGLNGNGGVGHSDEGIHSQLLQDQTRRCLTNYLKGIYAAGR